MELFALIRAKHNLVFKLLLIGLVSFLLALMLPYQKVKGHKVDAFNAIWPYADLVTDQDFFIRKSNLELKAEKEKIIQEAPLFFEIDVEEKEKKIRELEALEYSQAAKYRVLKPLIDSVYKRGVIESMDEELLKNKQIFETNGYYAEAANYYDFFTIKTAVEYLERETQSMAVSINYLDFLAITHRFSKSKTDLYLNSKLEQVSLYKEVIKAGNLIVKQGGGINELNKKFN